MCARRIREMRLWRACIICVWVRVREGKGVCHKGSVYVLETVYVYLGW